jgi:hypothetical protein
MSLRESHENPQYSTWMQLIKQKTEQLNGVPRKCHINPKY